MILAFDTYYFDDKAKTVCLQFDSWVSQDFKVYSEVLDKVEDYESGAFYKRELPCILRLIQQIDFKDAEAIIVDGFVHLDDTGKIGLGGHLYHALDPKIPVIGVAKTNFATILKMKKDVYRGESKHPLYVTAIGMDLETAAQLVYSMNGPYRIPFLLKELDLLTRLAIK